jgi:hypothetical protein
MLASFDKLSTRLVLGEPISTEPRDVVIAATRDPRLPVGFTVLPTISCAMATS